MTVTRSLVARAAPALSLYYRARVLCATAAPHPGRRPCSFHEAEALRQLRSDRTDNRLGTVTPEPAYRPNVLGQKQVTP